MPEHESDNSGIEAHGVIARLYCHVRRLNLLFGTAFVMAVWSCSDGEVADSGEVSDQICETPTKDCRCDRTRVGEACCLGTARGLECRVATTVNGETYRWGLFFDCGCVSAPECAAYPLLDLCPGASP